MQGYLRKLAGLAAAIALTAVSASPAHAQMICTNHGDGGVVCVVK